MSEGHFIGQGDRTTCGGKVLDGDSRINMFGLLHACAGDRVTCGVDGKIYRIVGGISHMVSHGRLMAGTLDSLSNCPCRARLIPSVYTAVYHSENTAFYRGAEGSKANFSDATTVLKRSKRVNRILLTYGDAHTPIDSVSRFYTDLNIRVETSGYLDGEVVTLNVSGVINKVLSGIVDARGVAMFPNEFSNDLINMEGEA